MLNYTISHSDDRKSECWMNKHDNKKLCNLKRTCISSTLTQCPTCSSQLYLQGQTHKKLLMCFPPEFLSDSEGSVAVKFWPCYTSEAAWSRHSFPSPPCSIQFRPDSQLCSALNTGAGSQQSFQEFLFNLPVGQRGRKQPLPPRGEADWEGKDSTVQLSGWTEGREKRQTKKESKHPKSSFW